MNAVDSVTQRDGMGNMLAAIDRKGQAVSMTYDPLNHPLTASYADGSTVSWTWDLAGRLTQVQDSVGGAIARSYDGLDRLISEITPQGMVSYSYDAAGRRLTMQAASQAQVSYSYDDANRLIGISQGSTSVAFGYDPAGRRISATLPGGITAAYTWDVASQLTGITYANGATTLGTLTYSYDLAGRVRARGGSLFQSVLPAAVTSATYNLANRLTTRTAAGVTASPTWDANGNLSNDGVRSYSWDARDRLSAIPGVASFVYDGLGRRQTATRGGTATSFLYDGWDVAQEQQGGSPSADLVLGPSVDERFSRSGATYLTDALGSTAALASSGVVQTSYGYDPYGAAQITGTASDNTFQFTGRENDGTGLLNYRSRYYNPAWGRFVSEDRIGLAGGINVYAYANGNPISFRDPSGKFGLIGAGIGGAIGGIGDLLYQLHGNGGNLGCVSWGQVAAFAGAGALAGSGIEWLLGLGEVAEEGVVAGAESASNIANGVRLGEQLSLESANSAFTASGELSEGAIAGADEIIPANRLGNPAIPNGFSKFTTDTFSGPSGSFQVHFYMNPTTGEVFYGLDYKAVFVGP